MELGTLHFPSQDYLTQDPRKLKRKALIRGLSMLLSGDVENIFHLFRFIWLINHVRLLHCGES